MQIQKKLNKEKTRICDFLEDVDTTKASKTSFENKISNNMLKLDKIRYGATQKAITTAVIGISAITETLNMLSRIPENSMNQTEANIAVLGIMIMMTTTGVVGVIDVLSDLKEEDSSP